MPSEHEQLIAVIDGLTKAQKHALGMAAINRGSFIRPQTAKVLMSKGLIDQVNYVISPEPGQAAWLAVHVTDYFAPPAVHVAWCDWCSRQPEVDE